MMIRTTFLDGSLEAMLRLAPSGEERETVYHLETAPRVKTGAFPRPVSHDLPREAHERRAIKPKSSVVVLPRVYEWR